MSKSSIGHVAQNFGGHEQHQTSGNEPSLVEDQHKWTVFNSQVNLPAVLNDPRLTRRETDFFTKTWGESFEKTTVYPSPHLQDITRDHFKRYLKRTTGVSIVKSLLVMLYENAKKVNCRNFICVVKISLRISEIKSAYEAKYSH